MTSSTRANRRARFALLTSTALVALLSASPAFAQSSPGTAGPEISGGPGTARVDLLHAAAEPQAGAGLDGAVVRPEPEIVISNPGTPTTARDPANVTGIGQMIVDNGGGSVGLCTGTLINPRTVIFAAHCVNSRSATAYGAASGGTGIGFGFEANLRSEAAGRPDELIQWLFAGPNQFKSNAASSFFNVSQVRYNPLSLEPAAQGFLYGDIAMATLDTPAGNVPTWALLFSALPATTVTANGTGYNVQIAGYGNNGNAGTGSTGGIDFRRRLAENMIGALTDLKTFETFLFGSSTSPTANLYFMDFDDPRRGLSGASAFDFNAFRDNARVTNGVNTEGLTAAGDSGGPLILQTFTRQVVAGVLSGGYTRFFNGQPANGYGTVSFYQPLYLYWDWISANNPYRYVSAKAGDGLWSDPAHWVTNLDPNYFIIGPNGQLVNGVPNSPGTGKTPDQTVQFGEICFQNSSSSDCLNVATGQERVDNKPIGTDAAADSSADGGSRPAGALRGATGWIDGVAPDAEAGGGVSAQALPAATLANGLPGATNFVPNNVDPVRSSGAIGTYFDVTLAAAGTTTLGTAVTVDRFSILSQPARLNITSAGSLTSLIDVTHAAGIVQVDGRLTSRGDYLLLGGGLFGSGRIDAPFLTSVTGAIAPGTPGDVGTLTLGGNLVLSSGSGLAIDLAGGGVSDRFDVVATSRNAQGAPTNGSANLGGTVMFTPTRAVRAFDRYTILTAEGGISGGFLAPSALSAILQPQFVYTANAVQVQIAANPYSTVINQASGVQRAYAQLLDTSRGTGGNLPEIFGILDLQNAATIQATLEALAPRAEALGAAVGRTALDNNIGLVRDRMQGLHPGDLGGRLAYYGRPLQFAALGLGGTGAAQPAMFSLSDLAGQPEVGSARLPETMSGFVSAGYLEGDSAPLPGTLTAAGRDTFDGFFVAGGLETEVGHGGAAGFALSYTKLDGNTRTGAQQARGSLFAANVYGKQQLRGFYVDAQATAGALSQSTLRDASLPGQTITLRSSGDALALAGEVGVGTMFGQSVQIGPRVAARASLIDFSNGAETGGSTALAYTRKNYRSFEGRAGLVLSGTGAIRPNATATFVHNFVNRRNAFAATFVGSPSGTNAIFDLPGQDRDWVELSGGLAADVGRLELSIAVDTSIGRADISNRTYRGSIRMRF